MKKLFKLIALSMAVLMLAGTLCGCTAFVEGFIEGFNSAMEDDSGSTGGYDDEHIFSFDSSGEDDDDDLIVNGGDDSSDDNAIIDDGEGDEITNAEYAAALFDANAGTYTAQDIIGRWVDHDDEYIVFGEGVLDYRGTLVEHYDFDGQFLYITYGGETDKWLARYFGDAEILVIYSDPFYYGRVGGTTADGILGRWESIDGEEYAFDFNADGTFTEDDAYAGEYFIEGNDMLLLYDDGTSISYGIFVVDGDQLGFAFGLAYYPAE